MLLCGYICTFVPIDRNVVMEGCDDPVKTTLHRCDKYTIQGNQEAFWKNYTQDTQDPDMLSKYRADKEVTFVLIKVYSVFHRLSS